MIRMMWLCLIGGLLVSCIDEQLVSGETVLVSSQFALSTTDLSKSTRQGADANEVMQDDGTFRGITDVYVLPFAVSTITSSSIPLKDRLMLSIMLKPTNGLAYNQIPSFISNNNAVLFSDVLIPLLTQSMLFYGRAKDYTLSGSGLTQADLPVGVTLGSLSDVEKADYLRHKNGVTLMPSTLGEGEVGEYNFRLQPIVSGEVLTTKAEAIVGYLKTIVDAIPASSLSAPPVVDFLDNKAGSSAHLKLLLQSFYNLIKDDADYSGVCTAILAGFKDVDSDSDVDDDDINSPSASFIDDYANYPRNIFLPDGAAAIAFINGDFQVNTGQIFGDIAVAPPTIYAYPPALCYRVNSAVRTATESQIDKYTDAFSWAQVLDGYTDDKVRVGTASVAIEDPVQYAVARLDMQVKCEGSTLPASGGQTVTLNANGFPITSILIDNQKLVDWQFEPVAPYDVLTVYDNTIGEVYAPVGSYVATTHTLLMQTPRCGKDGPSDSEHETDEAHLRHVTHIVLEMVNNTGVTFHGYNNQLILPDSHFYLVGEIDPCEHTDFDKDDPDNSRVLTQDKTTSVRFTITTLENAYNVIPDLRAPSLEVSLRIDTNWQVGYHFTEDPLVIHPTP